jgi:hypothetical protein
MKLLLADTVVLNVLQDDDQYLDGSAAVLSIIEAGYASGYLTPHGVVHIYDRLRSEMGRSQTHGVMGDLMSLISTVTVTDEVIMEALSFGWSDLRDAIVGAAAIHNDINYLIVRQPKDYRSLRLPVLTPEEFVAQSQSETYALKTS